jgi:hypothetical protein
MQSFESSVNFTCPKCNSTNSIDVAVPEFSWAVERMSDLESEGEVYFSCPTCECEFEGYARCYSSGCEINLVEPWDDIKLIGDFPMYGEEDEWLEHDIPENPYKIFTETYKQMNDLLEVSIDFRDNQLINRMVFIQIISAMEAYLNDSLLQTVINNDTHLKNLCTKNETLKVQTFKLVDIAESNTFIQDVVKDFLNHVIYHDIDKVSRLYANSMEIRVIKDRDDLPKLKKAVENRHDCVHRNGFDKSGSKNLTFEKSYVKETMNLINKIVSSIQEDINLLKLPL